MSKDSTGKPDTGSPENPGNRQDEDAVAFLQGLFELAHKGGTGPLNVMLDAGVPADIRTSNGDSLLMLACSAGHIDTARMLLDRGANPDLPNHQLQTPLMVAAISNHADLIDVLLEAGADRSLRNSDGNSALELAKTEGSGDAAQRLE